MPWMPKQPSYTIVGECRYSLTFLMPVRSEACCQHQIPTNQLLEKVGKKAPYSVTGKSSGFHHNPDMAGNSEETY